MRLNCLTLKNFRNIEFEKIYFENGINVIVGKNAQGKTNILEAIGYCSYLKSFRASRDEQLIRFGCDSAYIKAEFENCGQSCLIEITIFKDRPKLLRLNGIAVTKNRELIGEFLSIIFTPDHLNLIKEGPNRRRAFMDMALCSTDVKYTDALLRYQKVLLQRNALLKKGCCDATLLSVYDKKLAQEGSYIACARYSYIKRLEPFARDIFSRMSANDGTLKLLYINQFLKDPDDREKTELAMLERFERKRESDIAAGVTGSGIQKDDLLILSGGKSLKYFGSQGQVRSAVLSLIMAQSGVIHEKFGIYPVIILDDIMSELDRSRRKFIYEGIKNTQCIMSTCEASKAKGGNIIRVSKGRVI